MWIIYINREEPIIDQGALDELNHHQNPCGKSKVKIILLRRNIYQRTDPVRPVVWNLEVYHPEKPPTQKNIGEGLKGTQRKLHK